MSFSDYNEYILNNSKTTDTLCSSCNQQASLRYIKIKDVEPEVILVVFECTTCNIKESTIFNENTNHNKIVIDCHFTDKSDLKREVNLNMHALLFIEYEGVKYEHESSLPLVSTVEGLIQQACDALSDEKNQTNGDREEMNNAVEKMGNIKDNPLFYMRIEDNEGSSRVGRIDRGVYEMQNCSVEEFNDEKVKHSYIN
ncbi:hypothetical protein P3W45_001464 [Vairimorpha bombi]|jgi:C4-type Zn-finger protein